MQPQSFKLVLVWPTLKGFMKVNLGVDSKWDTKKSPMQNLDIFSFEGFNNVYQYSIRKLRNNYDLRNLCCMAKGIQPC